MSRRNVLVAYEPTSSGRAALSQALALAGEYGGSLIVAAVAPQERTDIGCAHCRANAVWWNQQMRVIARERLVELAAGLGNPATKVRYLTACGPTSRVLAEAAEEYDVDVIVLPWRRAARLRRLLRVSDAERLARRQRFEVVVAPRANRRALAAATGVRSAHDEHGTARRVGHVLADARERHHPAEVTATNDQ